jgi:two-component system cell cycle sensor histidine kinase PleC
MQSGRFTLDALEVDIEEVLEASLLAFRPMARESEIRLESKIAPNLPGVKGDPGKLRQVFGNLISNAVKFTPAGGTVTVEARATADGGLSVQVRDNGLGMTSEEIVVALTPFAQVDASRSRWREGTGLGLPIAKALVQLHGGRLEIRSTKSLGTDVVVMLPPASAVSDMNLLGVADTIRVNAAQ